MTNKPLHPDTALEIVLSRTASTASEHVGLESAAGRFLANDIVARDDHPPFPASTMDGYAVVAADVSPWREITGTQVAGPRLDLEVSEGYAVKIMTGAPLPRGADAVVRIEDIELSDDHVVITDVPVSAGMNIRPVGSDLASGDTVLTCGCRIGPIELGLIATMGYAEVQVSRRPRVAVISTGDELVDPGAPLAPGMIRDSNRFAIAAAVREAGAEVVHSSRVGDTIDELRDRVESIRASIDVLITSGGVSVGDRDMVKVLIGESAEIHFDRVLMKPGKPLTFATASDVMIFGLPGNPVSSMVSLELFVRPALLAMQGATRVLRETVPVITERALQGSDRAEFQRAVVSVGPQGELIASVTGNQISSRLASLLGANALLVIAPGTDLIPAGSVLPAMMLGAPVAATGRSQT